MQFIDLKDLTSEQLETLLEPTELTPDQISEIARLYWAQAPEAELNQYADWPNATPVEDFVRELKEEQRIWDEQQR